MKPNNTLKYVNLQSNHPQCVLRNIPKGINKRLSNISSSKEIFDDAKAPYQNAIDASGYKFKVEYLPDKPQNCKRKRSQNITWFNPPYDSNVTTNIARKFLYLVDKCFPIGHPLRKICNRNTLKVSYSCMPNVQRIIQTSNVIKLNVQKTTEVTGVNEMPKNCNCRVKSNCPLQENCLARNIVYQATVQSEGNTETYVGLTATTFKSRYNV